MRNMQNYLTSFDSLPFESIQSSFRKRKFFEVTNILKDINSVLEVGCGMSSIFETKKYKLNYLIEPINEFTSRLGKRTSIDNIEIYNGYLEDFCCEIKFDLIVLSCILHEVDNPLNFLQKAINFLAPEGFIYIDVPNANSLHRYLAVETGFLNSVYEISSTQKVMQQYNEMFTKKSLIELIEKNSLEAVSCDSFFLKPFHHERMQKLIDQEIITSSELNGFYSLCKYFSDFGSEIFVLAKRKS